MPSWDECFHYNPQFCPHLLQTARNGILMPEISQQKRNDCVDDAIPTLGDREGQPFAQVFSENAHV